MCTCVHFDKHEIKTKKSSVDMNKENKTMLDSTKRKIMGEQQRYPHETLVFVLIVSSEVLGVWRHVASYVFDDALDDALVCCAACGVAPGAFHGSCECCVSWCCWTIICHSEEEYDEV